MNSSRAKANERAAKALDEIEASVAVLDHEGLIVVTNKAWRTFATTNPLADGTPPRNVENGTNYLAVCRGAKGAWSEDAVLAHEGILAVLDGKRRSFSHVYPCHSPSKQRWFEMKVNPLRRTSPREVVVIHHDITERRLAEVEALAKQKELSAALAQLQVMAGRIKTSMTSDSTSSFIDATSTLDVSADQHYSSPAEAQRLKSLSKRELEVLLGLARGERNSEIALRLQLNKKSISTYRSRVLEKLKVKNNAEIVAFVARHNMS